MTVLVTLTTAGTDTGPFNLYSNVDGFISAFETGVTKTALELGYSSSLAPDFTSVVRVMSTGECSNFVDLPVTTTTTTTVAPLCNIFFMVAGKVKEATANYIDCALGPQSVPLAGGNGLKVCAESNTTYPYFSQAGSGSVIQDVSCAAKLPCTEYLLEAGELDTTYTYFLCDETNTTTTIVLAGQTATVCVDTNFGVLIVDGDGIVTPNGICTTTTTTTGAP